LNEPGVGAAYRAVSDRRVLRFGYGLSLNLAPLEFGRLVGLHIATLFVVWQITSFGAFHSIPTVPILLCGALIAAAGCIVTFWRTSPKPLYLLNIFSITQPRRVRLTSQSR
jgi:hypothetical protein